MPQVRTLRLRMPKVRKPQARTSLASKKRFTIALISMLSIATAIVAARAQAPATPPQSSGSVKLAEQQFKNIKVLKGIPADQVIPAMEFITASLGVECDFPFRWAWLFSRRHPATSSHNTRGTMASCWPG